MTVDMFSTSTEFKTSKISPFKDFFRSFSNHNQDSNSVYDSKMPKEKLLCLLWKKFYRFFLSLLYSFIKLYIFSSTLCHFLLFMLLLLFHSTMLFIGLLPSFTFVFSRLLNWLYNFFCSKSFH